MAGPEKSATIGSGKGALDDLLDLLPSGGKTVVDPNASTLSP
jgi:hypothetical protein